MKTSSSLIGLVISAGWSLTASAAPLDSSFSYQGQLTAAGQPASGLYDVKFVLYNAPQGGARVGPLLTNSVLLTDQGLFTARLDFGAVFDGNAYWLEVCVRPSGATTFDPLPRQPLPAVPQAQHAIKAGQAATALHALTAVTATAISPGAVGVAGLQDGAVTAAKIAPGQVVKSVNGLTDSVSFSAGLGLDLVGTTFRVAEGGIGAELLAAQAVAVSKIQTHGAQTGQVIAFDGTNVLWRDVAGSLTEIVPGPGLTGRTLEGVATLSVAFGGSGSAEIAAHSDHLHEGVYAPLAHGHSGEAISSGTLNDARLSGNVPRLSAAQTFTGSNSFVGAVQLSNPGNQIVGKFNGDGSGLTNVPAASLAGTLSDIQLPGTVARLGGDQTFSGLVRFSSGTSAPFAVDSAVKVSDLNADLLDGIDSSGLWKSTGNSGTQAGTQFLGTTDAQPLELKVNGRRAFRLEPSPISPNVVGGFEGNHAPFGAVGVTIAGGGMAAAVNFLESCPASPTELLPDFGAIGGGRGNRIAAGVGTTISGGISNSVVGAGPLGGGNNAIGGGANNQINGCAGSSIAGGEGNQALADLVSVGGGVSNVVAGTCAVVSGGERNQAAGGFSAIPGGQDNLATNFCFAAGRRAKAVHEGSFVWADATDADFASCTNNEFAVRAAGGAHFFTDTNLLAGVRVPPGGTGWSAVSDRNLKENLRLVDGRNVLQKLAAMPIHSWNMKTQDPSIRHIGPMSQDFHSAFALGEDDRHINSVDADGVALAAIQGLHRAFQEQALEIQELKRTVAELVERLNSAPAASP